MTTPAPLSPRTGRGLLLTVPVVLLLAVIIWLALGNRETTIFESASPFGDVRVTERADGLRALYTGAGRGRQTALYPDRPLHLESEYTRVGMIGLALVPADARILFVGLGGGAMPTYTRHVMPAATIDVVEIDPLIVDVAQRFFGFTADERMRVHTGDGRVFIEAALPASYDLIVLDAFSDDAIPMALATRQFLVSVRTALAPAGVVVSNLWTASPDYAAMLATYDAVFDGIHLLRVPQRRQRILIAGPGVDQADVGTIADAAGALQQRVRLGFDLRQLVLTGYERLPAVSAPVLEDAPRTGAALLIPRAASSH
jgi:spermidine synthase